MTIYATGSHNILLLSSRQATYYCIDGILTHRTTKLCYKIHLLSTLQLTRSVPVTARTYVYSTNENYPPLAGC